MNRSWHRPITDGGLNVWARKPWRKCIHGIMKHILLGETRKDPYSAACIYCYFYHKEHEIDRLTTVLECIRYGISPDDTMNYILKY